MTFCISGMASPLLNCSMDDFIKNCCEDSESLEDAILPHGKGRQGMIKLLRKEIQLAASPRFLLLHRVWPDGVRSRIPNSGRFLFRLPLGCFQSFQTAREANDLTYTALLPVAKHDVVRAKYAFCCFIEICYFTLTGAVTLIRMTLLSNAAVYRNNVLMNANLVYLAFVLLILGLFNAIFVGGFFQTAYKFAKPFVKFIIAAPLRSWGWAKRLFHIPGLAALNAFGFAHMGLQLGILALGILLFSGLTVLSNTPGNAKF